MEGYLLKKGRGESTFGRKNWKRRWFILEDQTLSYYEDFNLQSGTPGTFKGRTDVADCILVPSSDPNSFVFTIKHKKDGDLVLDAENEKAKNSWIKGLTLASVGKYSKKVDYAPMYRELGLDPSTNPDSGEISRAYRKAALKKHPDKGGNIGEFKQLQDAFKGLVKKLEKEQKDKQYETIRFEVDITKGPPGVGLGMLVMEDPDDGSIRVKEVLKEMMLNSISPSANGKILPGDRIAMVRNEDVTGMPMLRVVQKINDFRVPEGKSARMTFSRRVRKNGKVEEFHPAESSSDEEQEEEEKEDVAKEENKEKNETESVKDEKLSQSEHGNERTSEEKADISGERDSIDADRGSESIHEDAKETSFKDTSSRGSAKGGVGIAQRPRRSSTNSQSGGNTTENSSHSSPPVRRRSSHTAAKPPLTTDESQHSTNTRPTRASPVIVDPTAAVAAAEIELLKGEIEFAKRRIDDLSGERDSLYYENVAMRRELTKYVSMMDLLMKHYNILELQLEQLYLKPFDASLTEATKETAKKVLKKQEITTSKATEEYLQTINYDDASFPEEETDDMKLKKHEQFALKTLASLDNSSSVLKKWEVMGDTALEKLQRFESKIKDLPVVAPQIKKEKSISSAQSILTVQLTQTISPITPINSMETKSELRDYTQDQFVQHQQSMTSCKTVPTFEEPHVTVEQRTDGSSTPGRSRSNSGSSTKTPRPAIPNQKANIPPPAPVDTSKGSPVAPRKKVLSPNPSKQRPPLIYPKRN